jgi:AcrR family transcriptional regulator
VSPQRSNREALLDGALRCLAGMPADQITARMIAHESGANLASIGYHFESKDGLLTAAVIEGLDRWLAQIEDRLAKGPPQRGSGALFRQAVDIVEQTRREHETTAAAFVAALDRGQHDSVVAQRLVEGFTRTRPRVAELLHLGSDGAGIDAGAVMHSLFTGLLVQSLLSEELALDGTRAELAMQRIALTLSGQDGG